MLADIDGKDVTVQVGLLGVYECSDWTCPVVGDALCVLRLDVSSGGDALCVLRLDVSSGGDAFCVL